MLVIIVKNRRFALFRTAFLPFHVIITETNREYPLNVLGTGNRFRFSHRQSV